MNTPKKPGEMPPYLKDAVAAFGNGDLETCLRILREAHAADPGNANILNNLGVFSGQAGRIDDAIGYFRQAAALADDSYEAWYNLGLLLRQRNAHADSSAALARAVQCRPDNAGAITALALAQISVKDPASALANMRRAAELEPATPERWANLGNLLREMRVYDEARAALERALRLDPRSMVARYNLATLDYKVGDVETASAAFDAIVREHADEDVFPALERRYFPHISEFDMSGERLLALGRDISERMDRAGAPFFKANPRGPRLRIGLMSTDFRRHSCAYFLQPLFENRDRSRFELHCYADFTQAEPDAMTDWFRSSADHWTDTTHLSPPEIARKAADDRIDVLLELGGYTGGSIIAACAYRPAPAIVEWLGFPASTGVPEIGYRIGDAIADPQGRIETHFTEKLVRLDGPFLCFSAPPEAPEIAPPPILVSSAPTFGTFNNAHKIRAHTARVWTRIVMAVPGAKLLIKAALSTEPATRLRLRRLFDAAGLPSDRLVLIDGTASTQAHLGAYARLDVALDTFPYNGTTTTCEALWMGVPVVAFAGDRHSARVGATLLTHAGFPELVAQDIDGYVALAIALGQDRARLAAYRGSLRSRLAASPVMDGVRWARTFEAAIEQIYEDAAGLRVRTLGS